MRYATTTALLLAAVAQAAKVTLYSGVDCKPADQIGDVLEVEDKSGNIADANYKDVKPVSMLVVGYADVLLKKAESDIFDTPTCAYCANYYTGAGEDCAVDDGEKCVNINTGFGPGHAKLIAVGKPSPADLPCNNYQVSCKFPQPPANGFCNQG